MSTPEIVNDLGVHTTTMAVARVVRVHVVEDLLQGADEGPNDSNNYSADFDKYRVLGRLGGCT